MSITWLTLDVDYQEIGERSFSFEYLKYSDTHKWDIYLPMCVVQIKARWEDK